MGPLQKEYEYFLVLCETQNISRASEILGMQQGGLSKALKKLETSLGGQLFIRKGRGLKRTELADLLQVQLLTLKENWRSGLTKQRETLEELSGSLTIGAHPTIAIDFLSKGLPKLNEKYENLNISLILKKSAEILRDVIEHDIDFGIVANPTYHPDLVIRKLDREYVGIWGRSNKDRSRVIYYNPEMIEINKTLKKFKDYKHVAISNYEVLASFALRSNGLCVLPNPVAERYKKLSLVGKKIMEIDLCLIYRADRPKTRAFVEILSELKELF